METSLDKPNYRGFIVFTINVGQLPPFKAEAFMDRLKDQFRKASDEFKIFKEWVIFWLPTRTADSHVEIHPLDKLTEESIMVPRLKEMLKPENEFEIPKKEQVIDYILLMLGAPVVKIELDKKQLDGCYDTTKRLFEDTSKDSPICGEKGILNEIFQNIALARATITLGHIRSKYKQPDGITMDGEYLLEEGRENLQYWTHYLGNL